MSFIDQFSKKRKAGLNSLQQKWYLMILPHFFSKHQNKAENQDLDDSEVLISHWSYWPLQPHWPQQSLKPNFLKKPPDPDGLTITGTKITNTGDFLWNRA